MPARHTVTVDFLGNTKDLEAALARAGLVARESGNTIGDAFDKGATRAGNAFQRLGNSAAAWGVPFAGHLATVGDRLESANTKGEKFATTMGALGGATLLGTGAAMAGVSVEAVRLGASFQKTTATIAANSGISVNAAKKIGEAFLNTAGHSVYSGNQMAAAFAPVAGQLKLTEGGALSAGQALKVMTAAGDLAEASQTDLGTTTAALASVMQSFHLSTQQAAGAGDLLFNVSKSLNVPITTVAGALDKMHARMGVLMPSMRDVGALMIALGQHGLTGARSVQIVQSSLTTLTGGSKATTAMLNELGLKTTELFGPNGKFIGMAGVIDLLRPKLIGLNQQSQELALKALFGASAWQVMGQVIGAGVPKFDQATQAATRLGTAHTAAAMQARTLSGEWRTAQATLTDLGTKLGMILIPALNTLARDTANVVTWMERHKTVAEALAAVIGGVLGAAVLVFAEQKAVKFGQSIQSMLGDLQNLGRWITGSGSQAFQQLGSDADTASTKVATLGADSTVAGTKMQTAGADATAAGANVTTFGADATTAGTGVTTLGTDAGVAAVKVDTLGADSAVAGGKIVTLGADATATATDEKAVGVDAGLAAGGLAGLATKIGPLLLGFAALNLVMSKSGQSNMAEALKTGHTNTPPEWTAFLQQKLGVPLTATSGLQQSVSNLFSGGGQNLGSPISSAGAGTANAASQANFAQSLAKMSGLSPQFVNAWLLHEQPLGSPSKPGSNNWLNVGYTDSGPDSTYFQIAKMGPQAAAAATWQWLKQNQPSIAAAAGMPASSQVLALEQSGWASSHYGWASPASFLSSGSQLAALQGAAGAAQGYGPLAGGYGKATPTPTGSGLSTGDQGLPTGHGTVANPSAAKPKKPPATAWSYDWQTGTYRDLTAVERQALEAAWYAAHPNEKMPTSPAAHKKAVAPKAPKIPAGSLGSSVYELGLPYKNDQISLDNMETAYAKAQQTRQTKVSGSATSLITKLDNLVQTGSVTGLERALGYSSKTGTVGGPQEAAFNNLVASLKSIHSKAADELVSQLVAAHKAALQTLQQELLARQDTANADTIQLRATELKDNTTLATNSAADMLSIQKAQAQKAADAVTAQTTYVRDMTQTVQDQFAGIVQAVQNATQRMADASNAIVQGINDQTQTQVDILGERGLYGLNLIAQKQQVTLDQTKAGFDQQIALAQLNLDQVTASGQAAESAAQINLDQLTTAQDQLVAQSQQNADTVAVQQAINISKAQSTVDSTALAQDINVQLAQTVVDLSINATKSQQDAANAALKLATSRQSQANNTAAAALASAQNQANQANEAAQEALTSAQNTASSLIGQAQGMLATVTGQANQSIANAQQSLQGIQGTAAQTEAQLQQGVSVTQAQAQTQYAGSGLVVNLYGLNPSDAQANAAELGWVLRSQIPA